MSTILETLEHAEQKIHEKINSKKSSPLLKPLSAAPLPTIQRQSHYSRLIFFAVFALAVTMAIFSFFVYQRLGELNALVLASNKSHDRQLKSLSQEIQVVEGHFDALDTRNALTAEKVNSLQSDIENQKTYFEGLMTRQSEKLIEHTGYLQNQIDQRFETLSARLSSSDDTSDEAAADGVVLSGYNAPQESANQ